MNEDWEHRLPATARAMLDAAATGHSVETILQEQCPSIYQQVVDIGRQRGALDLWGLSFNFDELARLEIVDPAILRLLGQLAKVNMSGPAVHAGLQHTYGYLFSLIETPYGYKRTRWVETTLGTAFGLPPDTFTPAPQEGALLINLTYFLGRIAFAGHKRQAYRLRQLNPMVTSALSRFSYRTLQRWRVSETVSLPSRRGYSARQIKIHTDLILPPGASSDPEQLLLYWIEDSANYVMGAALITAFMVAPDTVETLLRQSQNACGDIQLRYNAYISDFGATPRPGMRDIARIR